MHHYTLLNWALAVVVAIWAVLCNEYKSTTSLCHGQVIVRSDQFMCWAYHALLFLCHVLVTFITVLQVQKSLASINLKRCFSKLLGSFYETGRGPLSDVVKSFEECSGAVECDGWGGGSLAPGAANCLLFPPQPGNWRGGRGDLPPLYHPCRFFMILSCSL